MCSSATWRAHTRSAETLKKSQEACLLVFYDQWGASCVVGAISLTVCIFTLKRRHHCLFCPSGARQEARKAVLIGKWCENFWTKHFQRKPHDKNLENTIKNPIIPCFQRINEVCSRFHGNRQTGTTYSHTDRTTTITLQRMCRGLIIPLANAHFWELSTLYYSCIVGSFWGFQKSKSLEPSKQAWIIG